MYEHFWVDMQKWKASNSLKIIQSWEKNFKLCSHKLNLRLQKQSASLAIKQMQSLYTVGRAMRAAGTITFHNPAAYSV